MTRKEEEMIIARLDEQDRTLEQQNKQLEQVIYLLKGSDQLEIEGVMPTQKRILKELAALLAWKAQISLYLNLLLSKNTWKVLFWIAAILVVIILWAKFGFDYVINWFKILLK